MSEELSRKLGYHFKDPELLKLSLTHRSMGDKNNERLEFLGDAIVNFIIAEVLYHQYPYAQEGDLSRLRARLVNRDALCQMARLFDMGRYLFLGQGELKSGGSERESILSCAMEAVIGAIYLDGGFHAVHDCVLKWYKPLLSELGKASFMKDPKTMLQEYLQRRRMTLPLYVVEHVLGEAHQQSFTVSCRLPELDKKTVGQGTNRRRAEQDAAMLMLKSIKEDFVS